MPKSPCSQGMQGGGSYPRLSFIERRSTSWTSYHFAQEADNNTAAQPEAGLPGGNQRGHTERGGGGWGGARGIELQPFSLRGDGVKSLQQHAALWVIGVGFAFTLKRGPGTRIKGVSIRQNSSQLS